VSLNVSRRIGIDVPFDLARKSFVLLTPTTVAQGGTDGCPTAPRRPPTVAMCTSSWAAICEVTLAIDLPSLAGALKVSSLPRD
jgi:hypothetical protein